MDFKKLGKLTMWVGICILAFGAFKWLSNQHEKPAPSETAAPRNFQEQLEAHRAGQNKPNPYTTELFAEEAHRIGRLDAQSKMKIGAVVLLAGLVVSAAAKTNTLSAASSTGATPASPATPTAMPTASPEQSRPMPAAAPDLAPGTQALQQLQISPKTIGIVVGGIIAFYLLYAATNAQKTSTGDEQYQQAQEDLRKQLRKVNGF